MSFNKNIFVILGIAIMFSVTVILCIFLYTPKLNQISHIEKIDTDEARLHSISAALDLYRIKNKTLPQNEKVRELLIKEGFVAEDEVFYSQQGKELFRYYSWGERYVLVSPGANGKYDSPQGFENLKEFADKTDDIIRFSN